MAGTVVAVFTDKRQAERASQALIETGVPQEDISLVHQNAGGATGAPEKEGNAPEETNEESLSPSVREVQVHDVEQPINTADEIGPRAVVGLIIGAPTGSLIVALASFFPSISAYVNTPSHSLTALLGGGAVGALLGAVGMAMTSGGIPVDAAKAYHAHVQRGDTLVTVLAGSHNAPALQDILRQNGGRKLGYFARLIDTIQSAES